MKVAICDDEILELNNTKQQLELAYKSLDLIVDTFTNGKDLLARVKKMEYDLIILDIEMPIMNGLEIAKKIRELDIKSAICFLTSHVEYALKGYEVNAMRYLTKPVKAKQLSEVVTFLMEQKTRQKRL